MRSIHPHKCYLCGWIERIPGGTRQDHGLEAGIKGPAAARLAWKTIQENAMWGPKIVHPSATHKRCACFARAHSVISTMVYYSDLDDPRSIGFSCLHEGMILSGPCQPSLLPPAPTATPSQP